MSIKAMKQVSPVRTLKATLYFYLSKLCNHPPQTSLFLCFRISTAYYYFDNKVEQTENININSWSNYTLL